MPASYAKIASGQSLSGAVDLRGARLVAVQLPSAWTAADLSFQAAASSSDTFGEVFATDAAGTGAAFVMDAAANQYTLINVDAQPQDCVLKVRSGPSGAPVAQAADRLLVLYIVPIAR